MVPTKRLALAAAVVMAITALDPAASEGQSPESAEELYTEYFGCWTCHGPRGQGGDGQPLRETYLPLFMYMKALRLPGGEMPPFSDILATDAELAAVYAWLEGADAVAQPFEVELSLVPDGETWPGGEGSVTLTVSHGRAAPEVRLRLTVMSRDRTASRPCCGPIATVRPSGGAPPGRSGCA
jgi:hypothetical protein